MARQHFGNQIYDIFPVSYTVPTDIVQLEQEQALYNHTMYILKIAAKDRGEGIKVISGPKDLKPTDTGIVQSYVQHPYLLNGYKFTMRVYVVYTSLAPLRLYIYPEGFVHMATDKYNPDPKYINERYMHLTNPDISKQRPFYKKNPRPFYWNFKELKDYIRKNGVNNVVHGDDDVRLWKKIQTLVQKTVLSAEHLLSKYAQKIVPHPTSNCFELLGLDVLVDDQLKPWLIEVNPDPDMSAHAGFALAYETKGFMLTDLMGMLGLQQSRDKTIAAFGTKKYNQERETLATLLFDISTKKEKSDPVAIQNSKYLKGFHNTGCNLKLATMACGVKSMEVALLIADSEMEYVRQGQWQRLIPSIESDDYSKWFYTFGDPDAVLACWEHQINLCTKIENYISKL